MESTSKPNRTERDKRDFTLKAWKRISLKPNTILVVLFLFFFMILAKLILSGIYLGLDFNPFPATTLALADEEEKEIDPELDKMKRMLRLREKEIEEKELALKRKEEELIPLREEINTKIEELNEIQAQLSAYARSLAEREQALKDSKIAHLVALYSAMEASRAAIIMDKLNIETIVRIFANMKGKTAGQILAMMDPEKGAMISEKLSKME